MDQRSEAGLDPGPGRLRLALAARAEADSLRARRAERLARIRAGAAAAPQCGAGEPAWEAGPTPEARDGDALERFLADLVGPVDEAPPQPARLAPVLPMVRPESHGLLRPGAAPAGNAADLFRLPGIGPGLVGALIRGGVPDLAALARLGRDALGQTLGPLARLVDLDGWLAFARAATDGTGPAAGAWSGSLAPQDLAG